MTELVANFTLNNNPLNADFDLSEGVELNALFQIGDAIWGKIAGDINDQLDLKDIIDTLSSQIEGNHSEITNINTTISGYGDIVTYNVSDFATASQGALANTALQPNDNISELVNDAGYVTESALNGYATESFVTSQGYITGINSNDVTTALGFTPYDSTNPDGYITSASLPTLEDLTTTEQLNAINSGATSTNIGQIATNTGAISTIDGKIPSAATTTNQLADKNFVNSSIATNTANFVGTFNSVSDLEAYSGTLTNNDYAFVVTTDTAGNTLYDRYKYSTATTPASWQFEYELNNSSFTADQWAAINSGITTNGVSLINSAVQPSDLATVATTGAYSDLTGKPDLTAYVKLNGGSSQQSITLSSGSGTTALGVTSRSSSSYIAFSGTGGYLGSYGVDSTKKPTFYNGSSHTLAYTTDIKDATLTIQKNGTTVNTFTANASSNVTCNITVPTDTNDLTNGAGYITSSAITNMQTTTNLVTSVSSSSTDSQYPSAKLFYDTCGDIETLINAL